MSTSNSSSRPILPKLDIPETDISMSDSATSSPATTPKPAENAGNVSPVTAINVSPITAILTHVHSNSSGTNLPRLERQNSIPRFRGTRLSDYDTDESDAGSVQAWRAEPPRRGELVEGSDEPLESGNSSSTSSSHSNLRAVLQSELSKAWLLNQAGLPRTEAALWQRLIPKGRGKGWVEDWEVTTRGRMGVKRVEGSSSGSGSPLRFGVSVEELGRETVGGYRRSRFQEGDVDGENVVGEGWTPDERVSDEKRERGGRKRDLGKRMWKKLAEWKK